MHTRTADVATIGAGTAGLNARREVEKRGGRPRVIEGGADGTTCARVGCMPSKLLIAAAEAAHAGAGAAQSDLPATALINGATVMARVERERDRFVGFVIAGTEAIPAEQRLLGAASSIGPTALKGGGRHAGRVARALVVATGSTPFLPPPFDAVAVHVLTSDDVSDLPDLPERPLGTPYGSTPRVFSAPAALPDLPMQPASAASGASRRRRACGTTQAREIPCGSDPAGNLKRSLRTKRMLS